MEDKKLKSIFKNKNFSLVFFGALVTNIGSLFYSFTVSFYILEITDNNAALQGTYLAACSIVYLVTSLFQFYLILLTRSSFKKHSRISAQ